MGLRKRYSPFRLARLLALALLLAQFGAELHVYYAHALADPVDHPGAVRSCGTCLTSAQLQSAAAPPMPALPAFSVAWTTAVIEAAAPDPRSSPFRAFRSRAPPSLV
jgi:hypothetical protein